MGDKKLEDSDDDDDDNSNDNDKEADVCRSDIHLTRRFIFYR